MKNLLQVFFIVFLSTITLVSNAQVSGIVYKDYNASGTRDNTVGTLVEPLVQGITVKAYSTTDALLATTTTDVNGAYSFTGLTLPVRIEFTGLPASYLQGCATNQTSLTGSSVQFITAVTTTADFRINNPDNFSQPNPMVLTPRTYTGPATGTGNTLLGTYYNHAQATTASGSGTVGFTTNATTGTTWGLAYSRKSKTVFSAAVVRNYMGTGPGGFDAIYTNTFSDPNDDATPAATMTAGTTIDLSALGVAVGTDPRTGPITGTNPYTDNATLYQKVGKIGIGDIDVSSDGDTLFAVNMNDGAPTLAIINVTTPNSPVLIADVAMPNPGCTNGVFRPWALKYFEGKIYVGGVCDASTGTAANLQAYVYRYDGGTTFTQIATMPLNYISGKTTFRADGTNTSANYLPWSNTWAPQTLALSPSTIASQPQPMLTDIEFLDDGSMVLGFADRFTFQNANQQRQYAVTTGTAFFTTPSGGDIIKFCNIGGVLTLESAAGGCLQTNTDNGSVTTLNPVGGAGGVKEFFDDDYYNTGSSSTGQAGHSETAVGALSVLAGRQQIIATSFDPVSTTAPGGTSGPVNTSGLRYYSNAGAYVKGLVTVDEGSGTAPNSNLKGNNLGDIELLSNPAPIEIGNRIWNDANANGIQDPNEAIFANVTVELFLDANNDGVPDGAALATVTTDANGQYIFSNQVTGEYVAGDPGFGHAKFNITQLVSKQNYIVRIGAADWNATTGQGAGDLAGYHLTTPNVVGNGIADWSDNDAAISIQGANNFAQIRLTTGVLGDNNHSYDFGFKNTIQLCGVVWNDLDGDASTVGSPEGPTEQVVNGTNAGGGITTGAVLYVNLINAAGDVIATTPIAVDGTYCFPLVPANTTGLTVQLTTNQGTVGQPKPVTNIPTGWYSTGENKNSQGGSADPGTNSEIPVTTLITNITQQNFGIQQVPESAVNSQVIGLNPGGTICTPVNPLWFEISNVGANPNTQDYNGGTVTNIRLTAFPSNATSITVNGTTYLSTDPVWPANGGAGITIPYTPGTGPTQTICLDPIDGTVTSVIPFVSIDNAGKEDPTPGSVTLIYTSILPIRLTSFTSIPKGATVQVEWKVATELNVYYYEILYSTNGSIFTSIGKINATNRGTYNFIHSTPKQGVNYYRLRIVDNDTKISVSEIKTAMFINDGSVLISPNPAKTTINVVLNSSFINKQVIIKVFDVNGKLAINNIITNAKNVEQLNISKLSAGSYLVKVIADNNVVMKKVEIIK